MRYVVAGRKTPGASGFHGPGPFALCAADFVPFQRGDARRVVYRVLKAMRRADDSRLEAQLIEHVQHTMDSHPGPVIEIPERRRP